MVQLFLLMTAPVAASMRTFHQSGEPSTSMFTFQARCRVAPSSVVTHSRVASMFLLAMPEEEKTILRSPVAIRLAIKRMPAGAFNCRWVAVLINAWSAGRDGLALPALTAILSINLPEAYTSALF